MTKSMSTAKGAVHRGRASDRVLHELRRMIITLELAPGAVVTEEYLCELLGCSRTPLREALQLLAREHLVVAVPRRGVSIAELSIFDFVTLLDAIDGVEQVIVRFSAERITDAELERLDELVDASAEAEATGDLAQVAELDFDFHHALGEACGNKFLIETQDTLHRLSMRFVYLGFQRAGTSSGAISDHRHIVEMLRTRDPDAVEAAVHEHAENARKRMRAAL